VLSFPDTQPECFKTTSHFTFQEGKHLFNKIYTYLSLFKTGLGFGAAIGFMGTLIMIIATVLAIIFAKARRTKGIQTFKQIVNVEHCTSLL